MTGGERHRNYALTPRQREILPLVAQGLSNKEIGRLLALSHYTVRNHLLLMMRIHGARSRRDLVQKLGSQLAQSSPASEQPKPM
jgi:DNA-binding CsgD family transcriptional regulator